MAKHGQTAGYTGTAKALHWAIVALLAGQFIVAWAMPEIRRNTVPETLINLHLSLGALILILVIVRLAWRLTHAEPAPADGLPPAQLQTARAVHFLLYVLLLAIPVLGWMSASFRGFPVTLFGLVELPSLMAKRAPGFGWTGDVHTFLSYTMLALVGLHVAATLYHWLIRRDGVLQRMLPGS
jgi:cytochrome b561